MAKQLLDPRIHDVDTFVGCWNIPLDPKITICCMSSTLLLLHYRKHSASTGEVPADIYPYASTSIPWGIHLAWIRRLFTGLKPGMAARHLLVQGLGQLTSCILSKLRCECNSFCFRDASNYQERAEPMSRGQYTQHYRWKDIYFGSTTTSLVGLLRVADSPETNSKEGCCVVNM